MLSKNRIRELRSFHLKKYRDQEQLFITEGVKSVSELLKQAPFLVKEIFATHAYISENRDLINSNSFACIEVEDDELKRISLQSSPNQVIALARYFPQNNLSFDFKNSFSLFLDEVRDPGNFGTILRLADWYGIQKIFCSLNTCDLYNPKVIQASMGAFLRVGVIYINFEELMKVYPEITVYGAVLNGDSIYKCHLKNGLILIGNEANGIPEEHLKRVDETITIPAASGSKTESLNAAMAAAIICSEFFRQLEN